MERIERIDAQHLQYHQIVYFRGGRAVGDALDFSISMIPTG